MSTKNSAKRWSKKQKKELLKKLSIFNGLLLIIQIGLSSLFFMALPLGSTEATTSELCPVATDVVLVIDRSGSMGYTSRCDWWQLECVNSPSCTSYVWQMNTTYDKNEGWCQAKNQSAPHNSVWTGYDPTKIEAAQAAANDFLNSMGSGDQSALVTFANTATLDKALSNNHLLTKNAIDNIAVTGATNIGDAISFASQELKSTRSNPQATKAIILLTDGKANKPSGSGSGENTADVTYAINKANEAAGYGYKIFTIGLGSGEDINESMLQQIADLTGANYHHAPNGSDLSDIYDDIAWEVCQYGSISGCVYNDQNNNSQIDSGEPTLSGWDITLANGSINLTQTLTDGCYTFAGLEDDAYTVSEVVPPGWIQTYPPSGSHQVTITGHNDVTNQDFANYFPTCGNDFFDPGETCELGDSEACTSPEGYSGVHSCNQTCDGWGDCANQETCGDGVKNGSEECDGTEGTPEHYTCTASCTLEYVPWCGDLNINNNEECDGDAPRTCETVSGYTGSESCDQCIWGTCQSNQSCGDGEVNGPELCDNNNQACTTTEGYNGTQSCSSNCNAFGDCIPSESCGDGIKNGPEECDGTSGIGTNQSCSATCILENLPYCGDGLKAETEECDDGNNLDDDGCSALCISEIFPTCGDNIVNQTSEQCDDGNTANGDGCDSTCQTENSSEPVCGNNILESGETCDNGDGNGDHAACSATCTLNPDCNDGQDNDDDTFTDQNDPGCFADPNDPTTYDPTDNDETDELPAINPGDIIINELMWMGVTGSNVDEWLELKNTTANSIDLSNCHLTRYEAGDVTMFGSADLAGKSINAGGYFILSNYSKADSKINIDPDIYASKLLLMNEDLQIKLFCDNTLIDTADDANGTPLAGSNGTIKKSMSRKAIPGDGTLADNWCTATTQVNWDAGATELGTPGALNVCAPAANGSLTVYNYFDLDSDLNTIEDQTLATTTTWTFMANSGGGSQSATTVNGQAEFSLSPATYDITEEPQAGWYLLGTNPTNQSISITSNQNSVITFYHSAYGTLAGYKFEDLDGVLSTVTDLVGRPGWLINLFPSGSEATLATTTTNGSGYFEFKNLIPGNYHLTEELKSNWQQLSSPPNLITIINGLVSGDNNFINSYLGGSGGEEPYCGDKIKNNDEQCDGTDGVTTGYTCNSACVLEQQSSGGGGGGGGSFGVCGNGIKEGAEICDGAAGTPAGFVCNSYCTAYDQKSTTNNNPPTQPSVTPPSEEEPSGIGGGPEDTTSPTGPRTPSAIVSGEATSPEIVVSGDTAGDTNNKNLPAILGAAICEKCPWWLWLILTLLHLATIIIYLIAVAPEKENKIADPNSPNGQKITITKGSWWWAGPVLLILAIIFLLLFMTCKVAWLPLVVVLGSFYLLLVAYYGLLRATKGYFTKIATIVLLTLAPIAVYFYCPWVKPLVWFIVIIPYVLALVYFWASAIRLAQQKYAFWGWFIFIASLLMVILEWLMQNCQCW